MSQKSLICAVALILLALTLTVKGQIVEEGLASYWPFDADTIEGDTAKDIWGNHDGTIFGDPQIVQGRVKQALNFDGEADYIEVPDSDEFKISGKAVSVEAWIKIESIPANYATVLSKRGTEYMFDITSQGEPGCFFLGDNTVGAGKMNLSEGIWYHVVWIWDESSGQANVYVDGKEVVDYVTADKSPDSTDPVNIGRDPGTADASKYHFHGIIDELRFYSRVLNEEEIAKNHLAQGLSVEPETRTLTGFWGKLKVMNFNQSLIPHIDTFL